MAIALIILLIGFIAWVAYEKGFDKGYREGEQWGRLEHHWYLQRLGQRSKRKVL